MEFWCASCHKYFSRRRMEIGGLVVPTSNSRYYYCSECDFIIDMKCAPMGPIECKGQPHIQHFSHQHPMPLVEIFPDDQVVCFACQSLCLGPPVYACRTCEYVLHKRCAEGPSTQLTHPSHPSHLLALHIHHQKLMICKSCEIKVCCFVLSCTNSKCNWNICIEFYLLPKYLNHVPYYFHSHGHPDLTLSKNRAHFACSLCYISYKGAHYCYECAACDFVVDAECALTPPLRIEGQGLICHFSHPHPMTLVDHRDDDGDRDGGVDDQNCFACKLP